eukprot:549685_1
MKHIASFSLINHKINITIPDVISVAKNYQSKINIAPSTVQAINQSRNNLLNILNKQTIYGVSTKVGDKCDNLLSDSTAQNIFQNSLLSGLQCGHGDNYFSSYETRAIIFVRLVTLAKGYSGVSTDLINNLLNLLNCNILPLIPTQGSVGASGDLIPNSYIGATIKGCRTTEVRNGYNNDNIVSAYDALLNNNIKPYVLQEKEAISIVNGLNVSSAVLSLLIPDIENIIKLSCILTGCSSNIMQGNPYHFDEKIAMLKPFDGVIEYCKILRLFHNENNDENHSFDGSIQQRYSIRCSPHIGGLGIDLLKYFKNLLEIELNSINDNPVIFNENIVLHSGNFYGGYLCFISDSLKNVITNINDMLDRQ